MMFDAFGENDMGTAKPTPRAAEKARQLAEYDAWYAEQVQQGIDQADRGEVVSEEELRADMKKHMAGLDKKYGRKAA